MNDEERSHQLRVAQALEDNKGVWFAENDEQIAVWYGGSTVNIYDSRTWEQITTREVSMAYRTDDQQKIANAVHVTLVQDGFARDGRTNTDATQSKVKA